MNTDIVDLREFYNSRLGRRARDKIAMALSAVWSASGNERLLGLGYTLPYLDRFRSDAEHTIAFMPAKQGAIAWPRHEPCAVSLVFDEELPLADSSIDRILMVHSLEFTEDPAETLKEIWRVLSPNGSVIVVVPNRRGVWCRFEHTPFGAGQPYSRGQLAQLLRAANFTPRGSSEALFFPPTDRAPVLQASPMWERLGRRFWPLFSGVIVMEAQKKLYQGLPVAERSSRRIFVPVLSPQPSSLGRNKRESD
ncbi:class I SAM-dependent methyltransferase [Lentilitoribacter sp. Alg239-R112]|uniref:class I SAM-dependent methyltransferase n=1 Tax=Lentilitoribacter sp. Alg239-R112 TaxID=2305987 RepID=UPI0013A6E225|nr:class I SAM-dependent methyltransferase [Lentilitoribacter sp. Alg239-R112]